MGPSGRVGGSRVSSLSSSPAPRGGGGGGEGLLHSGQMALNLESVIDSVAHTKEVELQVDPLVQGGFCFVWCSPLGRGLQHHRRDVY